MHRAAFLVVAMLVCAGCRNTPDPSITLREDFKAFFDAHQFEGSILIYDLREETFSGYNAQRIKTAFIPASTYKIVNTLVALETGVIVDENEVIPWDGEDRGWEVWNQDHTLRSAIK